MTDREFPDWHAHEDFVADLLGADKTVSSGNKWYDISDAVTRDNVMSNRAQFMADAKSTLKKSYSLSRDFLYQYRERAILRGKIFLLPVRFENPEDHSVNDWIVLHASDFSELLGLDIRNDSVEHANHLKDREQALIKRLGVIASSAEKVVSSSASQEVKRLMIEVLDAIDEVCDFIVKDDRE